MTKPNPYLWPARSWLFLYDEYGQQFASSPDRRFDLADEVIIDDRVEREVIIAISIDGGGAAASETEALKLEKLIVYDLGFDGYEVVLFRLPADDPYTYRWRARVRLEV